MSISSTLVVAGTKCKVCTKIIDGAMSEGKRTPRKGDFSVCAYCATIGRYTEELDIQPMSKGALEIMEEHDPSGHASLQEVVLMVKKN